MLLYLNSIREAKPGAQWKAIYDRFWPAYRNWFLSEGNLNRPGYTSSRTALEKHMPELTGLYERLCYLAGGGDLESRFLSMYVPPPYLSGCSQVLLPYPRPLLLRNYDYSPTLYEGVLLYSEWLRPVMAMVDCMWGVLDGINDAGLSVSLAFGGRRRVGNGFGIPLVLRYILETCDTKEDAVAVLRRLPVHMPYNVSIIDATGAYATVYIAPDRDIIVSTDQSCTNHQLKVEWEDYARKTLTLERKQLLEATLLRHRDNEDAIIKRFLRPPLFNSMYSKGFGTLYTSAYYPAQRFMRILWPGYEIQQSFELFTPGQTIVHVVSGYKRKLTL